MNHPDLSSNPMAEYIRELLSDGKKLIAFRKAAKPPKDGAEEPMGKVKYFMEMDRFIKDHLQPPVMNSVRQSVILNQTYECYLGDIWDQSNHGRDKLIDTMVGGKDAPLDNLDNLITTMTNMDQTFGSAPLTTIPPELAGGEYPSVIQQILTNETIFNDFRASCADANNTPENPYVLKDYLMTINIGDAEEPIYLSDAEAHDLAYGFIMAYQKKSYEAINETLGIPLYTSLW